jgi:hypothetical protein
MKTTPQTPEAEALREAYAALNRNDIEGFLSIFDPEIRTLKRPIALLPNLTTP